MKVKFSDSLKALCDRNGDLVNEIVIKGIRRSLYIHNNEIDFYNFNHPPLGMYITLTTDSEIQFRGF